MNRSELNALRREIERHEFLWIVDEASSDSGLAVHDRRPDTALVPGKLRLRTNSSNSWRRTRSSPCRTSRSRGYVTGGLAHKIRKAARGRC